VGYNEYNYDSIGTMRIEYRTLREERREEQRFIYIYIVEE
jgi:hypothetical protein